MKPKQQANKKQEAPPAEEQVQHQAKEEKPISDKYQLKTDPKSQLKIDEKESYVIGDPGTKVYCCKWDEQDKYVACACENGTIRVFNTHKRKLSYLINSTKPGTPFSYIKWRPTAPQFKTRNIFVTTNTIGEVQHWHLTSQKCLGTMKDEGQEPQLYCIDYNPDATKLAVCGSDPIIKIFDEEKRVVDLRLGVEQTQPPGHSNRGTLQGQNSLLREVPPSQSSYPILGRLGLQSHHLGYKAKEAGRKLDLRSPDLRRWNRLKG